MASDVAGREGADEDFAMGLRRLSAGLRALRIERGQPSLREIRRRTPTDRMLSVSAISDTLNGKRLPGHELFMTLVRALLSFDGQGRPLPKPPSHNDPDLHTWQVAWRSVAGLRDSGGRTLGEPGHEPDPTPSAVPSAAPSYSPQGQPLTGHSGTVRTVAFSPDGTLVATGGRDATVRLWTAATGLPDGDPLRGHDRTVFSVSFSPDGTQLAGAGGDGAIRLWDLRTRLLLRTLKSGGSHTTSVEFSPDGDVLATAGAGGAVRLWDPVTGTASGEFAAGGGSVFALAFSPDGDVLATAGAGGAVRLWDPVTGTANGEVAAGGGSVFAFAFSLNGKLAAAACTGGVVRLWDPRDWRPLGSLVPDLPGHVTALAFSPDGTVLAVAGGDGSVRLCDPIGLRTWSDLMPPRPSFVAALAFSSLGVLCATGDGDRRLQLYAPDARQADSSVKGSAGEHVVAGPEPETACADNSVAEPLVSAPVRPMATLGERARTADRRSGQPLPLLPLADNHRLPALGVTFRRDGSLIAAAYDDGVISLWDPVSRALRHRMTSERPLSALAFSPNGSLLAVADKDGAVTVRHTATGGRQIELAHVDGPVGALTFSLDGEALLTGGTDGVVRQWNLRSGTSVPLLASRSSSVLALAFAADGSVLAVGDEAGCVGLWDAGMDNARLVARAEVSDEGAVGAVAFGADGTLVAALAGPGGSGTEAAVALWRPEDSAPPVQYALDCGPVTALALSSDGTLLAAAVPGSALRRWTLPYSEASSPVRTAADRRPWPLPALPRRK